MTCAAQGTSPPVCGSHCSRKAAAARFSSQKDLPLPDPKPSVPASAPPPIARSSHAAAAWSASSATETAG
eukprot:4427155-Alexandrium_andersonii.AAC.1